jgi:hypothetical protein
LFNILNDHSIDLWKSQNDLIMSKNGLMNFIVHPDYVMGRAESQTYETLLQYLADMRRNKAVWVPLPGEVNKWWRQRRAMELVEDGNRWRIIGEGCERACVAYASERDGKLFYSFAPHYNEVHVPQ